MCPSMCTWKEIFDRGGLLTRIRLGKDIDFSPFPVYTCSQGYERSYGLKLH